MLLLFIPLITLATALLPLIVKHIATFAPSVKLHRSHDWLPPVAAFLFIISWFLPDIHISQDTVTFQQHFVGGGMYAACLFVYFKKLLGWKLAFIPSLAALFAWVSALGVANELAEFALTQLNFAQINTGDTSWDLLANTLGALVAYLVLVAARVERFRHN